MKILVRLMSLVLWGIAHSLQAQTYPAKPIRFIVGVPAGTNTDVAARLFAAPMRARLGQPILVENRAGGNLTIAANVVAKADPDGYTLFFGAVTPFQPTFVKNNAVDALAELAPVSMASSSEYLMSVSAKVPANNWNEALAWVKANPGKVNFASLAPFFDIIMSMLKQRNGLVYTSIPYTATSQALPQLLSGDLHIVLSAAPFFAPYIREGGIRPLFSTGRSAMFPAVPTAGDVGLGELDALRFNLSIWAPLKTPKEAIQVVSDATIAAARVPEVVEQYRKLFGTDPQGSTPEETRRIVAAELKAWAELARLANYAPQ